MWKQRFLSLGAFVLLSAGVASSPAEAQTAPYRAGSTYHNGQSVNAYTNPGAAHYRKTIKSSRGGIYNVVHYKYPTRTKVKLKKFEVPSVYSYKESAHQDLPKRLIVYSSSKSGRKRKYRTNLSNIIEREAKRHNIDPLLVEIVIRHESAFQPHATSRTGAQGLMQLMPGTATMLGVSDAYDPRQNVAGGTAYLAEQLATFKNLAHALAAYNAGPGAVRQYGGIPPYAETQNYVIKIASEYREKRKKKADD